MSLTRKLLPSFALFASVVAAGAFSATVAGIFGCSGSKSPDPASPAAASAAPASSAPAPESSSGSSAPASSAPGGGSTAGGSSTAGGGEKAEETPKNCNFRVKGFCLATEEEACNAAGCDPGKCMVLEGKPGKVKCK